MENKQSQNLKWNRVHFISPLFMFWRAIVILLGIIVYNIHDFDVLQSIYKTLLLLTNGEYVLIFIAGIAVLIVLTLIFCYLSWINIGYALDDTDVFYKHGIIFKKQRQVKINRIQSVDIIYPLVGRIFGLGYVKIDPSTSSADSIIKVAYMKQQQLEQLRNVLLARAAGMKVHSAEESNIQDLKANRSEKLGVKDLGLQAPKAPERILYEIDIRKYIFLKIAELLTIGLCMSLLLAIITFTAMYFAIVFIEGNIDISAYTILTGGIGVLALVFLVSVAHSYWVPFNENFGYKVAISPDGLRFSSGFTSLKKETVLPRRIHAIMVTQNIVARIFGVWTINCVTPGQIGLEHIRNVYIPLATTEQIVPLVHVLYKKLANDDEPLNYDEKILLEGMLGSGDGINFKKLGFKARILHPIQYSRLSYYVTDNVVLIRQGLINRKLIVVPFERSQSIGMSQGVMGNILGLANVHIDLVDGLIVPVIRSLDLQEAKLTVAGLSDKSRQKRLVEEPNEWSKRVVTSIDSQKE